MTTLDEMTWRDMDLLGLAGFIHGIAKTDGPKSRYIAETIYDLFTKGYQEDIRWLLDQRGEAGHCHDVPGVWDWDNGDLAGKPCETCARYVEIAVSLVSVRAS